MPQTQAMTYTVQPGSFSHEYLSQQQHHVNSSMAHASTLTCNESWPWADHLLEESPGSGSFASASTTYEPLSDESIPGSYTSSAPSVPSATYTAASTSRLQPMPTGHARPDAYAGASTSSTHHTIAGQAKFGACAGATASHHVPAGHARPGQCTGLVPASKPPLAPAAIQRVQASEHRRYGVGPTPSHFPSHITMHS